MVSTTCYTNLMISSMVDCSKVCQRPNLIRIMQSQDWIEALPPTHAASVLNPESLP